jgi:hypothetical protein
VIVKRGFFSFSPTQQEASVWQPIRRRFLHRFLLFDSERLIEANKGNEKEISKSKNSVSHRRLKRLAKKLYNRPGPLQTGASSDDSDVSTQY